MDERRRRRLAVDGGTGSADPGEEKFLPDCVPAELCAASPWIPLSLWKLWTIVALLTGALVAVAAMVFQTPTFRPELAPALDPLFRGEQPRLIIYLETMFWTLSGQLALLVGWHRSRSRLDFRGRYRIWPWAAAVMFAAGLCIATNLHVGLGTVIDELELFGEQSPRIGWMLPAVCLMLPLWMLMDRDVRRSLASVIVLRIAMVIFLSGTVVELYGRAWIDKSLIPMIEMGCGLFGSATLMLAMWIQGWYVAYVTPDPPAPSPMRLPKFSLNVFGWLFSLIFGLFRRRETAPAPPPRRRKKSEEAGTTKRKRKPAKRTTRSRARPKVAEEEEEAEEEDEAAEEESTDQDEYAEEETAEEDEADDQDYEEEETPPSRVTAPAARSGNNGYESRGQDNRSGQQSGRSNSAPQDEDDDEDDDQDDGQNLRADGPSAEQLKGLSKRQRRALIKQFRDQQRNKERTR